MAAKKYRVFCEQTQQISARKLPLRAVRRAANLIQNSCRWQLYHKKWSWLASARLRRGVMGESGKKGQLKSRTALSHSTPHS